MEGRAELERRSRSRMLRAEDSRRATVLLLDAGEFSLRIREAMEALLSGRGTGGLVPVAERHG